MKDLLVKATVAGLGTLLVGGLSFAAIGNDHTGFESENNASIEHNNEAKVEVANDAQIMNSIDGMLTTGGNEADSNTGSGMVDTGDADATVMVDNYANDAVVSVSGCDTCSSTGEVTNSVTGAQSLNNAWVTVNSEPQVMIDNEAHVMNEVEIMADTGCNSASYNTGDGEVSTGSASLDVSLSNTLNLSEVSIY